MKQIERTGLLTKAADQRILVLDEATGTALQNLHLTADDFGGEHLDGCNENLVFTRPDLVAQVHQTYLKAGCDIIQTNTFGATRLVLDEYGLGARVYELNRRATEIARDVAVRFSTPEQPRFVACSMGPTTKAISVTGGV